MIQVTMILCIYTYMYVTHMYVIVYHYLSICIRYNPWLGYMARMTLVPWCRISQLGVHDYQSFIGKHGQSGIAIPSTRNLALLRCLELEMAMGILCKKWYSVVFQFQDAEMKPSCFSLSSKLLKPLSAAIRGAGNPLRAKRVRNGPKLSIGC